MREQTGPISINTNAIRIEGTGGIGMLAMVILIALAIPVAGWLLAGSVAGGAVTAAVLLRRRHGLREPGDPMHGPLGAALDRESRERSRGVADAPNRHWLRAVDLAG